jgi:hypothetical protein
MFNYYYSAKFCLRDEGSTVQLTMDTCHCLTVRLSSKAALWYQLLERLLSEQKVSVLERWPSF